MTAPTAYEACFWAWLGMLTKDQGLAQAHEALDELLDAAHSASPVVQTVQMSVATIRKLTHTRPHRKPNSEDQHS